MMSRRSFRVIACLCVMLGWVIVESEPAHAQRLLQRLRERVGSRLDENQPAPANGTQPGATPTEGEATESSTPVIDALTDPDSLAMQALRSLLDQPSNENSNRQPELPARPGAANSRQPNGNLQPLQPDRYDDRTSGPPASLGINVLPTEPTGTEIPGLVVTSIDKHSLADEAGLRAGDTIVALNSTPAYSTEVVADLLRRLEVGSRVRVRFIRDKKVQEIQIPLVSFVPPTAIETLPPPPSMSVPPTSASPFDTSSVNAAPTSNAGWTADKVGLVLSDAGNRRGLVVSEVKPQSISQSAGIQAGDRIVAVDGRMISNRDMLTRELSEMDSETSLSLKLVRGQSLVVAELSPTLKPTKAPAAEASSSALGGFGSMLNGFFGGDSSDSEKPKPPKVEQADEKAVTPSDGKTVEQTGLTTESNRLPIPSLANDPPSLVPLVEPDQQQQIEELKRREREIQLELQRLRRQIKELESDAKED